MQTEHMNYFELSHSVNWYDYQTQEINSDGSNDHSSIFDDSSRKMGHS